MIRFNVKIDRQAFRREAVKQWQDTARSFLQRVADRMRELMRALKHGRRYGTHVASKAGEAPAVLTEALINSIGEPMIDGGIARLVISDPKARLLDPQQDDPVNPRVEPRPFVQPSIDGAVAVANKPGIVVSII